MNKNSRTLLKWRRDWRRNILSNGQLEMNAIFFKMRSMASVLVLQALRRKLRGCPTQALTTRKSCIRQRLCTIKMADQNGLCRRYGNWSHGPSRQHCYSKSARMCTQQDNNLMRSKGSKTRSRRSTLWLLHSYSKTVYIMLRWQDNNLMRSCR